MVNTETSTKLYTMTKEELKAEAQKIQEYLEVTMSEDINEIQDRGSTLSVYMARSGNMLAQAKVYHNKAMKESILRQLKDQIKAPASILNDLIKADCHDDQYLVDWLDRINRTCTHQMDWCRSMLSKAKEEMRQSSWQT